MRRNSSLAALAAAIVLACGVVAWEWYTHVGGSGTAAPAPVQAVTAAPSPPPATRAPATPTPGPVTYLPVQPSEAPATVAPVLPKPKTTHAAAATAAPAAPTATAATAAPPLAVGETPAPRDVPIEASTIAPANIAAPPVIREPADAPPRILSMSLSTPVAHGGETVSGTVETSSNVASVIARIGGYASAMHKVGVGKFQMSYVVPHLPFFLHRTWTIEITARNSRGDAVSSSVPITIR